MAMIMQGGETLKLIGYAHIQDTHDETEETHPTYILVSSYSAADKIYTAKKD